MNNKIYNTVKKYIKYGVTKVIELDNGEVIFYFSNYTTVTLNKNSSDPRLVPKVVKGVWYIGDLNTKFVYKKVDTNNSENTNPATSNLTEDDVKSIIKDYVSRTNDVVKSSELNSKISNYLDENPINTQADEATINKAVSNKIDSMGLMKSNEFDSKVERYLEDNPINVQLDEDTLNNSVQSKIDSLGLVKSNEFDSKVQNYLDNNPVSTDLAELQNSISDINMEIDNLKNNQPSSGGITNVSLESEYNSETSTLKFKISKN